MSNPQHLDALAEANRIRITRAHLKMRIKTGDLSVRDALWIPELDRVRLFDLLSWQSNWSRRRVQRAMHKVRISETITVGHLTWRQVKTLINDLEGAER